MDNIRLSRLTLIKEKAAIQYPITPESSLVCTKEEPPRLDSSMIGPDGLPKDIVSRALSRIHTRVLNLVPMQYLAWYSTMLGVVVLSIAAAAVLYWSLHMVYFLAFCPPNNFPFIVCHCANQ